MPRRFAVEHKLVLAHREADYLNSEAQPKPLTRASRKSFPKLYSDLHEATGER
jgi:hypothetical protein